ncbi:MAG: DUF2291 domain-containing protein [Paracoccaceae bacterium]
MSLIESIGLAYGEENGVARSGTASIGPFNLSKTMLYGIGAAVILLGAMALDTKVVSIGSEEDFRREAFSPDNFGTSEYPRIRKLINDRAVDAVTLSEELSADKKSATENHATMAGAFPVFPVKFTGTLGEESSGILKVAVEGLPDGAVVRVQSGPAINGTELRDFPGDIEFGAFTNQIEYQDAGAGINRAMSASILSDVDRESLPGSTVSVVGVFTMINPKNWLVTPVEFNVQ